MWTRRRHAAGGLRGARGGADRELDHLAESIEVAADLASIESVVHPKPGAAATYRALLPVFSSLYDALVPTFTELRRLDPLTTR
jgi:hypothetical protein